MFVFLVILLLALIVIDIAFKVVKGICKFGVISAIICFGFIALAIMGIAL